MPTPQQNGPSPGAQSGLSALFPNFLHTWNYFPRTQWLDHFITVNWNGGDADLEQHVLGQAGSYGLQLGRILDALDVLIAHADLSNLSDEEQRKIGRLKDLSETTSSAVQQYRQGPPARKGGLLQTLLGGR
jgi:hypothetical protein